MYRGKRVQKRQRVYRDRPLMTTRPENNRAMPAAAFLGRAANIWLAANECKAMPIGAAGCRSYQAVFQETPRLQCGIMMRRGGPSYAGFQSRLLLRCRQHAAR